MLKGFFITGTDTDIGKTYVALKIITLLQKNKFNVVGVKPLASGGVKKNGLLMNEDALLLQKASSVKLPYSLINPICFESPIAPYIAAKNSGEILELKNLLKKSEPVFSVPNVDYFIVEGVGGWFQPINSSETMIDFAQHLNFPVILVVGMRLGCINHSLLTYESIKNKNVNLAGWIANCIDPKMLFLQDNILVLREKILAPLLGVVNFDGSLSSSLDSIAGSSH